MISVTNPKRSGKGRLLLDRSRNPINSSNDHFINQLWYREAQDLTLQDIVAIRKIGIGQVKADKEKVREDDAAR